MSCGITTQILGTWCIGDSLPVINDNFTQLENAVCDLSANSIYTTNTSTVSLSFLPASRDLRADINDKSITNAKLSFDEGNYGFRNKLINGCFDFWQRGFNFNAINSPNISYTADRWGVFSNGNTLNVTCGIFGSSEFPVTNSDFLYPDQYLKLTITNAPSTSSRPKLFQRIEGGRTLQGRKITLSFYASATTTTAALSREVRFELIQHTSTDSVYTYPLITSVLVGQWKKYKVTLTVPLVPSGIVPDNDSYLEIGIIPEATLGDFMITGVQLEPGEQATAYEVKSRGVELELCQRFFEKSYDPYIAPGTITDAGSNVTSVASNTNNFISTTRFQTTKRGPIVSTKSHIYNPNLGTVGSAYQIGGGNVNMTLDPNITSTRGISFKPASGVSAGVNSIIEWHYVVDAEFYP